MKSIKLTYFLGIFMLLAIFNPSYGQNGVAIAASSSTADASAMLDVQSTTKGALIPRMTTANRNAISLPATGLLVYCTDVTPGFYYNSGTPASPVWVQLSAGALSGTGTVNYHSKWTSTSALGNGVIYDNGTNIGIGTTNPYQSITIINSSGVYTNVESANSGIGIATGTNSGGVQGTQDYILYMGADKTNDVSYIQSVKWGIATANLVLNGRGGNVGIGTPTPTAQLHTTSTVRFANYPSGILSTDATGLLQTTPISIAGTASQVDVTNGNGVLGNPTINIDATYTEDLKSNFIMTGGGTVSFANSVLGWSARFIVINNGYGSQFSTTGYFDISQPPTGTSIPVVGGGSTVTATAAGVPLTGWQALYYILPIGSGNGVNNANFRVANFAAAYTVPENWVLIASVNGEVGDGAVRLGNGLTISGSGSAVNESTYPVPPGTIVAYGGTTAPAGWLICDGTAYSQASYAKLYAAIGTNFGNTAGGANFNVPDLRGRFIRGWDNGASNDPDHAARTALNTGGLTGNNVGSYQGDQIATHYHIFGADDQIQPQGGYTYFSNFSYDANSNSSGGGVNLLTKNYFTGNQTHPRNVYTQYIIKY